MISYYLKVLKHYKTNALYWAETPKNWSNINIVFTNPLLQWPLYIYLALNKVALVAVVGTKCGEKEVYIVINTHLADTEFGHLLTHSGQQMTQFSNSQMTTTSIAHMCQLCFGQSSRNMEAVFLKTPLAFNSLLPPTIRHYSSAFTAPSQIRSLVISRGDMKPKTMLNANLRHAIKLLKGRRLT